MNELSKDWKQRFRRRLRSWYRTHRRDLPWRGSRDPYRVWVSEVMLQQTQVATVRDYYTRFMERLPTVQALAAAEEQEVLRLWEGLGYYRRARQLHVAARVLVDEHGGEFPSRVEVLQKLPGIGRYTAGAIASIAFNRAVPILEANTERLYARLVAYAADPASSKAKRELWSVAQSLVPRREPGEFNQALMELGSLVCTPREPACHRCPVAPLCTAHSQDVVKKIPPRKRRQICESVNEAAVVVQHDGKILIRQCQPHERWAGLWDFPRVPIEQRNGERIEVELARRVAQRFGVSVVPQRHLATIKHGVTRFRITLDCYTACVPKTHMKRTAENGLHWVALEDLPVLPLHATGRKIAGLIERG